MRSNGLFTWLEFQSFSFVIDFAFTFGQKEINSFFKFSKFVHLHACSTTLIPLTHAILDLEGLVRVGVDTTINWCTKWCTRFICVLDIKFHEMLCKFQEIGG